MLLRFYFEVQCHKHFQDLIKLRELPDMQLFATPSIAEEQTYPQMIFLAKSTLFFSRFIVNVFFFRIKTGGFLQTIYS